MIIAYSLGDFKGDVLLMLIFKTKFGNFGTFKDLFLFMHEEKLKEIEIESQYIFDRVFAGTLSYEEVCELYKKEISK